MKKSYERFLKKVAHFQVENPYLSVFIILVFSLMIWGGVSQVKTVASLEQMMPKDTPEIASFNDLRDNNMGQDMIAIVLELDRDSADTYGISDIRDIEVYNYVNNLEEVLLEEVDVLETYSFVDVLDIYSQEEITSSNYDELVYSDEVSGQLGGYVNDDYTTTVIMMRTDISANDMRMNLLSSKIEELVDDLGHPRGIKTSITGTPVIQKRLGELINKDRTNTQWISTLLVFTITMIIFRSFTSAVVPIIVVFLSVNWLYGTMGYTNLPISTLAGGVAAMVIGIGIDFAIHIMNKFKYERKLGCSIKDATELAVVHTGVALTATSLTTISAFLAFLFGVMPEMGRFGILMAIGIFYSLVFSIFGLPAFLILEERLLYYLKSRARFGIEGEFEMKEARRR